MRFRAPLLPVLALSCAFAVVASSSAQTAPPKADPPKAEVKTETKAAEPPKKKSNLKEYKDVVTAEAVTSAGMFKVHRIGDRILWEVPAKLLGREFLWQTVLSQTPNGTSYPGEATGLRVVRFERRNDGIFMRDVSHGIRSVDKGNDLGVRESTVEPIIMSWDVSTEGPEAAAVFDVTSFFLSDPADFAVKSRIQGGGVDSARSYPERVKAYEKNVEMRMFLTFSKMRGGGSPFAALFGGGGGSDASTASVVVHHSVVLLPEKPMMGRLKDSRIGFFTSDFTAFGRPQNASERIAYINRFRLEKKNPAATVSEPVQPIVFYVSREVPEKWRSFIRKGIEDWQPAFEAAGFKNAIIAKDAPTREQDPDWDPEDARYSVIRWAASPIANAMGPSIQDPRSGETISAHIIMWNDIFTILDDWSFAQLAASDPKYRKLPLPDSTMGELVRYVVAHEVGHTLGLEHNFKSSAAYSVAQLRDPEFTKKHGVSPSIMDYSRFNYVAQPGDGVTNNLGQIGAYDTFAIQYGYRPIENARTPEEEKAALDRHLAQQVTRPDLRFGNYLYPQDPTTQSEDIGSDAIEATRLGLRNLDTIASQHLMPATLKFGEDYSRLGTAWQALLFQRTLELGHVVRNIGGVVETDFHAGRGGDVFQPVPAEKQRRAAIFLTTEGLRTPKALFAPNIINKLQPEGVITGSTRNAETVLRGLMDDGRARRLIEAEALYGKSKVFTLDELIARTFDGAFSELAAGARVDPYRRSLQRAFLRVADGKANGATSDLRMYVRENLRGLAKRIDAAVPRTADATTRLHLLDSRREIERILTTRPGPAAAPQMSLLELLMGGAKSDAKTPHRHGPGCWQRHIED